MSTPPVVQSIIQSFLQERLGVSGAELTENTTLESLGIDSLMLLELMFECEEKLGIKLSQDVGTPTTVGELLHLVEQLQAT